MWNLEWTDFISFGLITLAYVLGFRRGVKFCTKQAKEDAMEILGCKDCTANCNISNEPLYQQPEYNWNEDRHEKDDGWHNEDGVGGY